VSEPYYDEDGITIYHGDCREIVEWLEADVLVTDPPYGISWSRGEGTAKGQCFPHDGIVNDEDTSCRDEAIALWGLRPAVIFGSFYAPFPATLKHVLVWQKPANSGVVGATTGYRRDAEPVFLCGSWPMVNVTSSSVLRSLGSGNGPGKETGHPHAKPVGLLGRLISATPAGVVADPFMGSGTTLVAAKQLGRKAIGIEIEERYCEIAVKRLAQGVLL
jgi:DNA modification methylase